MDVQIHPAGTPLKSIRRYNRSTKVTFTCPQHGGEWRSKEPAVSQWFGGQEVCACPVGDFVTAAEYMEPLPSKGLWDAREDAINGCPEHLYTYSPANTRADTRWVFKEDLIFTSQDDAYDYAMRCKDALSAARATAIVTGSVGAVHEVRGTDGQLRARGDYTRPKSTPPWESEN